MPVDRQPLLSSAEYTSAEAQSQASLGHRKNQVRLFLGLVSILSFPLAASQIVVYDLLFEAVCAQLSLPIKECANDPGVAGSVADILSAVSLLNGVIATIVMVVISAASDKLGRKFGLIWFGSFMILSIVSFPLMAYSVPSDFSHWRMLLPYIFAAIAGTPTLMLNMSVLYIIDFLPEPHLRTEYLSLLLGSAMLVQASAPGLGSALLQKHGITYANYMFLCAIAMTAGLILLCSVLEEPSHAGTALADGGEDSETHNEYRHGKGFVASIRNRVAKSFDMISFAHCKTPIRRRNAWILLLNFFFSNEFAVGFLDLISVYAKHTFGWAAARIGQNIAYMFSVKTAWALVGFPFIYNQLVTRWPAHPQDVDRTDLIHMYLGAFLTLCGYIAISSAKTSSQYTAGTIVLANDAISGPIWINALLKHVPMQQKGEFMGALSLANKPAGAVLPAMLMKIFQQTVDTQPNLVFYLVSIMAAVLIGTIFLLKPTY
nr:ST.19 [Starmerella bombicola]